MSPDSYGGFIYNTVSNEAEAVSEEVNINGWSLVEQVFDVEFVSRISDLLDEIYYRQEQVFGRDMLMAIGEADQARCLTRYNRLFLDVIRNTRLRCIVEQLLGTHHILQLQNAVLNRGDIKNHQSAWHRDLPYQNFVCTEPLAINLLLVIDTFDELSGGTEFLPYSHKMSKLPSSQYIEKHKVVAVASPGDVLVFDSMLYHKAGNNRKGHTRRGLNNQLCKPFIKPQYQHSNVVPEDFIVDDYDAQLLGKTFPIDKDEKGFRQRRIQRQQVKK